MEEKIQKSLILLFSGVFAVIWITLWFTVAVYMNQSKKICLLALFLLILFLAAAFLTIRLSQRLRNSRRLWRILSCVLLVLMAAGLL